ncbi:MAG: hypothetical protein EXS13_06085 [Planctomycetes bacterium]|nr:hypothetical protein [Planctomycetota bacterium]
MDTSRDLAVRCRLRFAPLLFMVGLPAARAQVEHFQFDGPSVGSWCGHALATIGDLDGDGIPELLVSSPHFTATKFTGEGRVDLISGATGLGLRSHVGTSKNENFGIALIATGDLDLDGVPDYVASAPQRPFGNIQNAGALDAFSGATGQLLWTAAGAQTSERFGAQLARLEDLDGDGRPELLATNFLNEAIVVDGLGARVRTLATGGAVISSIAQIGDRDGDGYRDIAVGNYLYDGPIGAEGRVLLFSAGSGAALGSFSGSSIDDSIGYQIVSVPDVDGDGIDEIAVSGRIFGARGNVTQGMVQLRDGATLTVNWSRRGVRFEFFGISLSEVGDWNRDGVVELAATSYSGGGAGIGSVGILSCASGNSLHEFEGASDSSVLEGEFGMGTTGGDWNGDGLGDVAIGIRSWFDRSGPVNPGAVRIYLGCPAFAASYGVGWPGTLGTPALAVSSNPAIGATVTLTADNSLGGATLGLLLIGLDAASVPLHSGATLLVDVLSIVPITVPAGGFSDSDTIPDDPALCFIDFYLQVIEFDVGAVGKLSFTNGLQLRIGFDL